MKRTTCWPDPFTSDVHAPAAWKPVAERRVKYGDVAPPVGRTVARSASENVISTGALRETPTWPGGGTIDTMSGGDASRTSGGSALSLPLGPTSDPPPVASDCPAASVALIV